MFTDAVASVPTSTRKPLLFALALAIAAGPSLASADVYRWVDEKGGVHFSDQPPPAAPRPARVETPAAAALQGEASQVPPSRTPNPKSTPAAAAPKTAVAPKAPSPPAAPKIPTAVIPAPASPAVAAGVVSPIPKLRAMLREGRFEALNALLEELRVAALADVRREDDLMAAYEAFDVNDKAYEPLFDRWVDATPHGYQPRLARGKYLYEMGWHARGSRWASETPDSQMDAMGDYLARAAKDFKATLERQARIIVPYGMLVWMVETSEENDMALRVLQKSLEVSPASAEVRTAYLHSHTPRWGGSYEQMAVVIKESKAHVARNPKLKALAGYIAFDKGDLQSIKKNYAAAEKLFTEALSHGEHPRYYLQRALARQQQEKYDPALSDINRAIELWPHGGDQFHRRSVILAALQRRDEALRDIEIADLLSPNEEYIAAQRKRLASEFELAGYRLQQLKDTRAAIKDYDSAIRANPADVRPHLRKARALVEEKKYDEALAGLERARQVDPNEFDVCVLADWILARQRDWDRIIGWWDRFIASNPGHSGAYVERGGAHFHKGDMKSALRDAKQAADLGSPEGRQLYERFSASAAR